MTARQSGLPGRAGRRPLRSDTIAMWASWDTPSGPEVLRTTKRRSPNFCASFLLTGPLCEELPIGRWAAFRDEHSQAFSPRIFQSYRRHSRSEEHTSELQARLQLVCRLLLEKK